ncbi:MAG: DUF1326 domain-containing protein [Acidobacteriia bacterium]|nr:DUF1326 domain-containing protein [Terriglobia bacterium]
MSATTWRIKGDNLSSCNCDWGCPCQFNARPTHGNCEAFVGMRINEGNFGGINLSGVVFSAAAKWPGAIHEGNGTIQLFIDEKASAEQRSAVLEMASGKNGGAFFEIFAAICPNVLDPIYTAIAFEADREKRTGRLRVDGAGQSRIEPIRNPVTGEEHRARINLPGGFEFKVAEVANAVNFSVTAPEVMRMDHSNCHAHLAEIDWSN